MMDCMVAAGNRYSSGYFRLMGMKISDLLFHLEVFLKLQKQLKPEQDKHAQAGFTDADFLPYDGD